MKRKMSTKGNASMMVWCASDRTHYIIRPAVIQLKEKREQKQPSESALTFSFPPEIDVVSDPG